ncbi:MAG: protein kinase [Ferruginibacter sp.]
MKTGGQASVYKGKREGNLVSAVKIIPTPVLIESNEDKNYRSFINEVQKLLKVNEEPNPNVVSILGYGITTSGNFPYIEMEFIEGPDVCEIVKKEGTKILELSQVISIARDMGNALAHCHKAGVKHGDIKSNNVKFNTKNGKYVLLDFGLSVMSDEDRRTSFRNAGAIEFMSPEQFDGEMLFESDIYSYGVILFELLAGQVPFPLTDQNENARNQVMVAHRETLPPDLNVLRKENIPAEWSAEKKTVETTIPLWLTHMIYTCLEKEPARRFKNGKELNQYIQSHATAASENVFNTSTNDEILAAEVERLRREKLLLEEQLQEASHKEAFRSFKSGATSLDKTRENKSGRWKTNIVAAIMLLVTAGLLYYFIYYRQPQDNLPIHSTENIKEDKNEGALAEARDHLLNSRIAAALVIYKNLAERDVPEANYQYGNMALQGLNTAIDCDAALAYIKSASADNYAPAKRTLGFIYAFADDEKALSRQGYRNCGFTRNVQDGATLLMEARLSGDADAGKLLEELNANIQSGAWRNN